ncbi:MAG TPA: prepilin-type N-terminal cleavage/methylation domain-containing protein [Pseudobdellovibrionaceae bacterium]|nr:prepilin-type N-terminal cleavage/methylation domain-containing protein [Pseudobdellovibrionaceae bacterium]
MFKLNNKGFSLVELMVVVAIIGILSSIAIPSINKYMAKARQSEAKTNLASLYTANKAFFAEYSLFDSRFDVIGYRPEGQLRYNIGWATPSSTVLTTYGYTTPVSNNYSSTRVFCQNNTNMCTSMAGAAGSVPMSITPVVTGVKSFRAGAGGRISGGATDDVWTITDTKMLENQTDGTQ